MDDKLEFLSGDQPVEIEQATLEPAPEPAPAPEPEPPPTAAVADPAVEARLYAMGREFSRRMAVKEYGAEQVTKVHDWGAARCDEDPNFNQRIAASDDPYEAVMQAWKREQLLSKVSIDDLDEYTAWKAAKTAAHAQPSNPIPQPQAPPPRSLVNAPGNGAAGRDLGPHGPGTAFDALPFNQR